MSRKIVILDRVNEPSDFDFNYVLRATTPGKIKDFYKGKVSILADATQEELDEVANGLVVETTGVSHQLAKANLDDVKAQLVKELARFQAEVSARNPWKLKGTSYDGVTWTDGGIA